MAAKIPFTGIAGIYPSFITKKEAPQVQNLAQNNPQGNPVTLNPATNTNDQLKAVTGDVSPAVATGQTSAGPLVSQNTINSLLKTNPSTGESLEQKQQTTLQNQVEQSQNPSRFTEVDRLPFVLTCQKWIDEASKGKDQAQTTITTQDQLDAETLRRISVNRQNNNKNLTVPARMGDPIVQPASTSNNNVNLEEKYIFCNVNPSQVSWEFPIRAVDQLTLGGRVQHVWRSPKRRNSYFDEPKIRFTFQSGNILPLKFVRGQNSPKGEITTNTTPGLPAGLSNFYRFFELFDQPRIVNDVQGKRQVNKMYIFYNSRVFPQMTLTGMWTPEGISFEENAEDPHQVNWSASFTVYDSYPRFGDTQQLIASFQNAGFGKAK